MAWYDELNRVGSALGGLTKGLGQGANTYYDILNTGLEYNQDADRYDAAKAVDLFNLQAMLQAEQARTGREAQLMQQMRNQTYLDPEYRNRVAELTNQFGFGSEDFQNELTNFAGGRGNALAAMDQQARLKEQVERNAELKQVADKQALLEEALLSQVRVGTPDAVEVYKDDDGQYIVIRGEPDAEGNYEFEYLSMLPGGQGMLRQIEANNAGKSLEDIAAGRFATQGRREKESDAADLKQKEYELRKEKFITDTVLKGQKAVLSEIARLERNAIQLDGELRKMDEGLRNVSPEAKDAALKTRQNAQRARDEAILLVQQLRAAQAKQQAAVGGNVFNTSVQPQTQPMSRQQNLMSKFRNNQVDTAGIAAILGNAQRAPR